MAIMMTLVEVMKAVIEASVIVDGDGGWTMAKTMAMDDKASNQEQQGFFDQPFQGDDVLFTNPIEVLGSS